MLMPMTTRSQHFDVSCDDSTELQKLLNSLYAYKSNSATKYWHRSRIALFHLVLEKLTSGGLIRNFGTALDIGCNAGFYSKVISDFGFHDVSGIDINPEYIAKANETFGSNVPGKRIAFTAMNAAEISRLNKTYDFILCTEVIEHTDAPLAVIDGIMQSLARGGIAVISLPNSVSLGYLTPYLADLVRGRGIGKELRDHLKYPFFRGPGLFKHRGARIVGTTGVNCLLNDRAVHLFHRARFFNTLNRANFWLSRRWPFKFAAQFFFFVIQAND